MNVFDEDLERAQPPLEPALELVRGIWAVEQAARQLSRLMTMHLGVTGQQRLVLRVIGQRPGIAASALAHLLRLDAANLSAHLRALHDLELVEWSGAVDASAKLALTARGRRLDHRAEGTIEAAVLEAVRRAGPQAQSELETFLHRLEDELVLQTRSLSERVPPRLRRGRGRDEGG